MVKKEAIFIPNVAVFYDEGRSVVFGVPNYTRQTFGDEGVINCSNIFSDTKTGKPFIRIFSAYTEGNLKEICGEIQKNLDPDAPEIKDCSFLDYNAEGRGVHYIKHNGESDVAAVVPVGDSSVMQMRQGLFDLSEIDRVNGERKAAGEVWRRLYPYRPKDVRFFMVDREGIKSRAYI